MIFGRPTALPWGSNYSVGEILVNHINGRRTLIPDENKSFDVFADIDFSGNWHRVTVEMDSSTVNSRYLYIVMYTLFPISYTSKL